MYTYLHYTTCASIILLYCCIICDLSIRFRFIKHVLLKRNREPGTQVVPTIIYYIMYITILYKPFEHFIGVGTPYIIIGDSDDSIEWPRTGFPDICSPACVQSHSMRAVHYVRIVMVQSYYVFNK